jgi:hypothetical protein
VLAFSAGGVILSQHGRLAHLEAALPTAQIANAISGTLDAQRVQKIQSVIAEAKKSGGRIEPEALTSVSRHLVQSSVKDPALANDSWKAIREMVGYRTTLNAVFLPPLPENATDRTTHYAFLKVSETGPQVRVFGSVPRDQGAILELIGSDINKELPFVDQYVVLNGGDAGIDSMEMRNVIFQNVHIVYRGGPIKMTNVYFVNCTFDFPQDQRGQNLAFALLQSPTTTFSAS